MALDGKSTQLTDTPTGTLHYHSAPSPDGKWLAYGPKREDIRQLYRMRDDKQERRLTDLAEGQATMWPHWQPTSRNRESPSKSGCLQLGK